MSLHQITEDYVSFETAKLLKEKGFKETSKTIGTYNNKGEFYLYGHENGYNHNHLHTWYSAPTLQMAMKWLREAHDIIIVVEPYMYNYVDSKTSSYIYSIWCGDNYDCKNEEYNSYEEAVEAAIKYCLENLI